MTGSRRTLTRTLVGLALATGAVVLGAQAASAHDSLIGTTPGDGESVTSVAEISQTFSENLIDAGEGNFAEVTGPDGLHYESGCSVLSGPTVTTPVALGDAGTYHVAWRAVSSDGHPIADEYTFDYAPDADAVAAAGSSEAACAAAADTETTETTETDAGTDAAPAATASGVDGLALGLGIGGAGVVVVVVAVVLILRSRRS